MAELNIVILAAGAGKRMRSNVPKVMHRLAGKPLLTHVTTTAASLNPARLPIVVYGHQGDILRTQLADLHVTWVEQAAQLGTGHALQQALPHLGEKSHTLVLYGDVPLISNATLCQLIDNTPPEAIGIITAQLTNPTGYGRIVRDTKNNIVNIVEEKEAAPAECAITEINSGIYYIPTAYLKQWLPQLHNNNAQKEFYLTDLIRLCKANNIQITSISPASTQEILGVNDPVQLAELERAYQYNQAVTLMREGVTVMDPHRLDIRGTVKAGKDVILDINVILEGNVIIGNECTIGPNSILKNVVLGDRVTIRANSILEECSTGNDCIVGPFGRLRPGTELADHIHIGNFVEVKNSTIDSHTKINHLSYIGDSEIGKKVNIGAGTITCNYDGANKNRTTIADNVFIGSDTQLIAPVKIGEGATIGAGSTISRDAPPGQLTVARAKAITIANWQRPKKKEEV